jgi:hypothetical protein
MGVGVDVLVEGMKGKPMGNKVLIKLPLPKGLLGQCSEGVNTFGGHFFESGNPITECMG